MGANTMTMRIAGEYMNMQECIRTQLETAIQARKHLNKVIAEDYPDMEPRAQTLALREHIRLTRLINELVRTRTIINKEAEIFLNMVEVREDE